jgi:hypothetical protein
MTHIPDWQSMPFGQGAIPGRSLQANGGPAWQWFPLQT